MYAPVRAPVPGAKSYRHNKGMFIHGGDESVDVRVICDDNLIEPSAYWEGKKKLLLIQTLRLGYRQGWGPTGHISVAPQFSKWHDAVVISTLWQDELWKFAVLNVINKRYYIIPHDL